MIAAREKRPDRVPELLAPAGDIEAGYAAFQCGADAVYLGLPRFSARADAINCTPEDLGALVAYAHGMVPRRRVYVAINTLVLDHELDAVVEALAQVALAQADAVIVQDLGVARLAQRFFTTLALHASTQMAVHSLEGARVLRRLGFKRVTLARELTLPEIKRIAEIAGIEVEVFAHGALCYSYSGLCLYSSLLRGRSGNRGRCAYPCRDRFTVADENWHPAGPPRFYFSMKDMAMADHVGDLRRAGVAAFKIEGRKKSPLYVAAATTLYRGLIDNTLDDLQRGELEADLRSVFSRPWTSLFMTSRKARAVTDPDMVGHRGVRIGAAGEVAPAHGGDRLRFVTERRIERHDGLQIDLPDAGRPYGFAIDELWLVNPGRAHATAARVFEAPAGATVEVRLPPDHPIIPGGAAVYCSSSQEVKQKYDIRRPRADDERIRLPVSFSLALEPRVCRVAAAVEGVWPGAEPLAVTRTFNGEFPPATNPAAHLEATCRVAFGKLGRTGLRLQALALRNAANLFVPVSLLNEWRRQTVGDIERAVAERRSWHMGELRRAIEDDRRVRSWAIARPERARWTIKIEKLAHLRDFPVKKLTAIDEIVVDISQEPMDRLLNGLKDLAAMCSGDRIRLALPPIMRRHDCPEIKAKAGCLVDAGWRRWEVASLAAWDILRYGDSGRKLDLSADYTLHGLNRSAIEQLLTMGVGRVTFSPEDTLTNMTVLASIYGGRVTVVVYQDSPLFISEICPRREAEKCRRGKRDCDQPLRLVSDHDEKVMVVSRQCRAVTIGCEPFTLAGHVADLQKAGIHSFRADFLYRPYTPEVVWRTWRAIREGTCVSAGHEGNYRRGLL